MTAPNLRVSLLAGLLFVVSGALGLGYQLVWIRKASLVVGASQIAMSTVLTSFFLGLALGSLVVGRRLRSRRLSPLFVYGLFEAAIGLYALSFPFLFGRAEAFYAAVYWLAADSQQGLFLLRFGLLFMLFLIPTFFMGGTLPLLLDGLIERDASVGSLTSVFYGLNIIGALIGVLVTGYFAIPQLGMNGTSVAAGFGNLTIALVALVAFRRTAPLHTSAEPDAESPGASLFFCALAFVSGLAAIGYQISWARYFSLFKTATVHLTAILLAVYLLGLAAGSLIMARMLALGIRPLRVVAVLQPVSALLVLYGLGWWIVADYALIGRGLEIEPSWRLASEVADTIFFAPLFQIGLVILLPVTLLGTALPGLIAAATPHSSQLRGTAGRLVFWNTLGASAGGFGAGYVLIPTLGLTGTLFCLTLLTLGLGAAAESRLVRETAGPRRWSLGRAHILGAVVLAAAVLFLRNDISEHTVQNHGVGRMAANARLVALAEGPLTTASFFSGPKHHYIASGNQIMAFVDEARLPVQAIQGHLPALFYPRAGTPRRALGIAIGSGQSFGALLRYPIEQLDVVDISAEMVELSLKYFKEYNRDLGSDPRVTIHLDDGRHFVERAAPASYDVISMEPPPPTAEGVHALYSLEFYRAAHRVLREDGVLMQWLPPYFMTPNECLGIVKTQAVVFPYSFVVRIGPDDFATLSFKRDRPPRFNTAWIKERAKIFAEERWVATKRWTPECRHGTASLEGILALLTTGPNDIARMDAPYIYHDDDQRLSYSSGDRQLLRRYRATHYLTNVSFGVLPITPFEELQQYFIDPIPAAELGEERARALAHHGLPSPRMVAAAEKRFREAPDPASRARWAVRVAALRGRDVGVALSWLQRAIEAYPATSGPGLRGWVRYHVRVDAAELHQWLDALPPSLREASLARVIEDEVERFTERGR